MTISEPRQGRITIPLAKPLPAGTLAAILKDAAYQLETTVEDLITRIRP